MVPTIFAPIVASAIFFLFNRRNLSGDKKLAPYSKATLLKTCAVMGLAAIVFASFVQSAYPFKQSLNLDTLTTQELGLLVRFASSVNLNQTLYLGEYPTMRYLSGIRSDWPMSGGVVSEERVKAFTDLAYYGNTTLSINMSAKLNITDAYVIVLERYAGPKIATWYGGDPYISNLTTFGDVVFANQAGYILKLDVSKNLR